MASPEIFYQDLVRPNAELHRHFLDAYKAVVSSYNVKVDRFDVLGKEIFDATNLYSFLTLVHRDNDHWQKLLVDPSMQPMIVWYQDYTPHRLYYANDANEFNIAIAPLYRDKPRPEVRPMEFPLLQVDEAAAKEHQIYKEAAGLRTEVVIKPPTKDEKIAAYKADRSSGARLPQFSVPFDGSRRFKLHESVRAIPGVQHWNKEQHDAFLETGRTPDGFLATKVDGKWKVNQSTLDFHFQSQSNISKMESNKRLILTPSREQDNYRQKLNGSTPEAAALIKAVMDAERSQGERPMPGSFPAIVPDVTTVTVYSPPPPTNGGRFVPGGQPVDPNPDEDPEMNEKGDVIYPGVVVS